MRKAILTIATLLLFCTACQKKVEYPIEPRITYDGFTYLFYEDGTFTGEGILRFSYTDGDGDLGLDESDSNYPFGPTDPNYYNLIIDYKTLIDGQFVSTPLLSIHTPTSPDDTILFDTVTFSARFKRLRDNEEPKAISGSMEYTLPIQNPFSPDDTIQFAVHILDRALHQSNTIETDAIFTNPILK